MQINILNETKITKGSGWTLFLDRDGVINTRLIDDYVKTTDELDNLKTITFTVPENTKPGEYKLKGGHIWVKYGPTWWTRERNTM